MALSKKEPMVDDEGSSTKKITSQISEKVLISTGIRIGTTLKTKYMEPFIAKTRPSGLHIIDLNKTLSRIEIAGKFLTRFDPKKVLIYSSRDFAKTPIERFCELTGCQYVLGRFMPGTLTNPRLPFYKDVDVVMVVDPTIDQQAIVEASSLGIPVIAVCDTDNVTSFIDLVIPANNRGRKALAAIFWFLARSYLIHSGAMSPDQPLKYNLEDFETKLVEEVGET
jgi:small subunit ribosomal protein S2